MSSNSDLLSTLEIIQLYGSNPGTIAHNSSQRLILYTITVIIITVVGYDYCERYFVHAILLVLSGRCGSIADSPVLTFSREVFCSASCSSSDG